MLTLPILIALSMVALLVGAAAGLLLQGRGWGIASLKGLMASFLGGLLLVHLLPEAYSYLGPWSLLLMLAGFLVMILPERLGGHSHEAEDDHSNRRFFTAEMLWAGLIIHQLTDGVGLALAASQTAGDWHMAMVVLAHRIPVAAVVIWLFHQQGKPQQAWLRIAGMALATVVGAVFYQTLAPYLSTRAVHMFYAFIAGSFLHLMTHDFIDHHAHLARDRRGEFLAFMLGIGLLFWVESAMHGPDLAMTSMGSAHAGHDHAGQQGTGLMHEGVVQFFDALLVLLRETAPYLLLGLVISGLLHRYMPQSPTNWLRQGGPAKQSLKGMVFGLPLPICSCGVLPLFLGLARKGVPPACLVAFLIATPELGVDSFLLSVKLLGVEFSMVRLMIAMVLPMLIALIAVRFLPSEPVNQEPVKSCCSKSGGAEAVDQPTPWWRFSFIDLVDDIFPYVFFGLMVAALAQVMWPQARFGELVGAWDVLLLGALGIPFYVCASASVPFALILLQQGFSVGAVVVFLFAGPATNVATLLTVDKAFGKGAGLKLAATSFLIAVATGFLINSVYTPDELSIFDMHEHGWTWWNAACAGLIALLGLGGLYRQGPLHWISTVLEMVPGLVHHPPKPQETGS